MGKQLDAPTIERRFNEFIEEYEKKIAKEKAILLTLDPIESSDDILYELEIRRDALKECCRSIFKS